MRCGEFFENFRVLFVCSARAWVQLEASYHFRKC